MTIHKDLRHDSRPGRPIELHDVK